MEDRRANSFKIERVSICLQQTYESFCAGKSAFQVLYDFSSPE